MRSESKRSPYPEKWTLEEREEWIADYLANQPVEMPYGDPYHEAGECDYCDTLRELRAEADAR